MDILENAAGRHRGDISLKVKGSFLVIFKLSLISSVVTIMTTDWAENVFTSLRSFIKIQVGAVF